MTSAAALWLADSGSALQHLYLIKWPGTDLKWQFCPLLAEPGNCRLRKKFGSELFIHLVGGFDSCGDKDFNFFPKMAKFQVSHWNFYIFESFGRSLSYPAQTNFLAAVNVKVDLRYEYLWAEQQTWGLSRSSESSLRVSAGGSQLWPQRDGELQIICRIKVWTHCSLDPANGAAGWSTGHKPGFIFTLGSFDSFLSEQRSELWFGLVVVGLK